MAEGRCVHEFPQQVIGDQRLPCCIVRDECLDVSLQELRRDRHRGLLPFGHEPMPPAPSPDVRGSAQAFIPPSTVRFAPVMYEDSGPAMNDTNAATSSTCP